MKIKPLIIAMPVAFTLLTGCALDSDNDLRAINPFAHGHILSVATNGQTIQKLMDIDKGEIALAKLAKQKAECPKVKALATMLQNEHARDARTLHRLVRKTGIRPETSAEATHIVQENQRELAKLRTLSGDTFSKAYLDTVIACHRATLQLLDTAIIQSTDTQLTAYLKAARDRDIMHLDKAKMLRSAFH